MKYIKNFFLFAFPLLIGTSQGCTTVKYYPANLVESLKHPTKFPEVFSFTVQNIEEIAAKNPLTENEDVKVTDVGENKNSSMHLIQVCREGELHAHYHKRHDEVIYVKKGSGIATLDGTRYMVKPGSIVQIPSKTVHKFLNTGGEPFIAISIFSPPFDGRDEKTIKKKKKIRGKKEERRLASRKPEKTTEKSEDIVVNERLEEEAQVITDQPMKIAEKSLNKPAKSEWEADSGDISEPFSQSREFSASKNKRDKKKIKKTIDAEEPQINIRDLHEKLTKLSELRNEGTITEEEYEKKKDALVKGRDIGDLPEVKGSEEKKVWVEEDDDVPIFEQMDRYVTAEKSISDENQDAARGSPYLSDENESTTYEIEPEETTPSLDDKLKTLEEIRHEGLITEEEYEEKRRELIGTVEDEPISVLPKNTVENERIKELEELYDEGLITEDDYNSKKKELLNQNGEEALSPPYENIPEDERIDELRELYNEGLITEEDYKYKIKNLTDIQPHKPLPNVLPGKEVKDDMLTELNELKEQGLISEEDYEFKKSQILGN